MSINRKLTKKLDKLLEKYSLRDEPLTEPSEYFMNEIDDELVDKMENYKFYYEITEKQKDVIDIFNFNEDESDKIVNLLFFDEDIVENLKEITKYSGLYSSSPDMDISFLYTCINELRLKYHTTHNNEHVKLILDFVEELYGDNYKKMDKMIEDGKIDYNSLWYYFDKVDTVYSVKYHDFKICMKYNYFEYLKGDEPKLALFGKVLYLSDDTIKEGYHAHLIDKFSGTRSLDTFEVETIKDFTQDSAKQLIEYGKKTYDMRDKIELMYLKGNQYIAGKTVVTYVRDNRVIVDNSGIEKFDNKPFNFEYIRRVPSELTDEDYLIMFPLLGVYSMSTNKCWGMSHIKHLTNVEYQDNSFDYLVLDDRKKSILKGLIRCHRKDLQDFIKGKGQGLIFLLNGPPGVGKTLTAEATSEYLRRPLYSINVGDLGTDPEAMEGIMERIIEYSERWGAIILVDEADIFLEEREFANIMRNALVSTFMKFLEFNRGIMFLTTNRLSSIDDAVKSRVNMFFSYKKLSYESRKNVWTSLLKKWKLVLDDTTIDRIAEYEFNGREIRNYMRLVMSILDDRELDFKDDNVLEVLDECYELANEFDQNVTQHMYA